MTIAAFPDPMPTGLFLDGDWRDSTSGETTAVINPASEEILTHVARCTEADIDAAIASAVHGFEVWRSIDAWTRSGLIRRVADILRDWNAPAAAIMTAEQGKPLRESASEWNATADQFDWYADEARRLYGRTIPGHSIEHRLSVWREPIGVAAAFASWNFPALLPARKIAPALAAGCSVIVRPAEEAPLSTLLIAEACRLAGIPDGVVTMLTGSSSLISSRLIESPHVRKISLTGSVPVGRTLLTAAAKRILPASMELGGHAPVLIFPDADIAQAARDCVAAKFRNAGQVCASPSRFYAHESVIDEFTEAFVRIASELVVGDPTEPGTDVGPLTNQRRVDAADELVRNAVGVGARVALGGQRAPSFSRGFFYEPTVLAGVPEGAAIMHEEPFGPVAPVAAFRDMAHAIALANSTDYGLASFIYTRDLGLAYRVAEGIEAGMVGINTMVIATAEAPFGGVKQSGYGREGGSEGILDYTIAKYVNMRLP